MGKMISQSFLNHSTAATGRSGPDREPMALINCPSVRFLEYLPSGDTSRIRGFPATCSVAAPAPSSRTVTRKMPNESSLPTTGTDSPSKAIISPSIKTYFLPFLSWYMPMGMDSMPNMMNPAKAMSPDTKFESSNLSLARLTKGPTASPKPMHRKARNTGNVLFFIDFKYQYK